MADTQEGGLWSRLVGFSRKVGERLNGQESMRLQEESTAAFKEGDLGTSAKLALKSASAGAEHVGNLVGKMASGLVSNCRHVEGHGSAPTMPAAPTEQGRDQPAR
jgi:hypothetical protein